MNIEDILELRPQGKTVSAFRQAIAKIEAKTLAVDTALASLLSNRGVMLASGSKKDLELSEKAIQQARENLDRLSDLASTLQAELPSLDRAEALTELRARFDAIGYAAKAEAFAEWWKADYRRLAQAIVEGLELEAAAVEAMRKVQQLRSQFEELGEPVPAIRSAACLAAGGALRCQTLGELVTLPGEFGAPEVGVEFVPVVSKRLVQEPIFSDDDRTTPAHLLPQRTVEIEEKSSVMRLLREDKAFWPRQRR